MYTYFSILIGLTLATVWVLDRTLRPKNLPPGPRGFPLIGNIFNLPPKGVPEYQHWLRHKEKYGPLSSIHVFGQTLVVIHNKSIAVELLEKNAKKTSGRPQMEFSTNLCGFGRIMATRQHDTMHKLQRKLIHQQFGSATWAARFENVQRMELLRLIQQVQKDGEDLIGRLKLAIGAMILQTTYGYQGQVTSDDPLIALSEQVMNNFSKAAMPMTWAVDAFPMLQHLPEWFPGASFRKIARQWRSVLDEAARAPYQYALGRVSSGEDTFSYVSRALEQDTTTDHDAVKWSATTLYGAGTDTTLVTLKSFILAMVKFPEVQARAVEEMKPILDQGRLPKLADRSSLPYIDAIVKEVYRWHPAGPLGLPHMANEAIEYDGLYIPKNSIIFPAVRWFCHDPDTYVSPEVFDPSRFLSPRQEPDPKQVVFGYGRRNCLGRYFADASIFQTASLLLSAFKIEAELGTYGNPRDAVVESTTGLLDHVKPFPFKITSRYPNLEQILKQEIDSIHTNTSTTPS